MHRRTARLEFRKGRGLGRFASRWMLWLPDGTTDSFLTKTAAKKRLNRWMLVNGLAEVKLIQTYQYDGSPLLSGSE